MLMEIRFLEDGEVVAAEEGTVTEVRQGTHGLTSVMSFCGSRLTVAAEIPYRATSGQASSMDVGYKIRGLSPRSVAELFKVLLGLRTSKEVEFHIDGRFLTKYGRSSDEVDNEDPDLKEQLMVYRFAEDLAAVLAYTRQSMTLPNGFSGNDRVHARVARLLLDGHIVASALARGVRGRLPDSAEPTQEIRNTLTERRNIHWPAGRYTAPIVGRNFDLQTLGDLLWTPRRRPPPVGTVRLVEPLPRWWRGARSDRAIGTADNAGQAVLYVLPQLDVGHELRCFRALGGLLGFPLRHQRPILELPAPGCGVAP